MEILKQFVTMLFIINAVLIVTRVVQLSEIIVAFGFSLENLFLPILYTVLPFLTFTIPISFLFAVFMHYSRLNQDGEFTAMQAAGFSLRRAALPMFLVAAGLYICTALSATHLESWGRREFLQFLYRNMQTQLDNFIKVQLKPGVFFDDFLGFVLYAEEISPDHTKLNKVLIAPRKANNGENYFTIFAPTGLISGSVENGDLKLNLRNGRSYAYDPTGKQTRVFEFNEADINLLKVFPKRILGEKQKKDDFRSYNAQELSSYVDRISSEDPHSKNFYKASYLFHQRIGVPFIALIFGIFGMVLGIQDLRQAKNHAFMWVIVVVLSNYVVIMGFKWLGEQGLLPAILAVWIPNIILLSISSFMAYQKGRLPPSERIFARENLPNFRAS